MADKKGFAANIKKRMKMLAQPSKKEALKEAGRQAKKNLTKKMKEAERKKRRKEGAAKRMFKDNK